MTTTTSTADRAAIEAAITTELSREPEGDLTAWRSLARRLPGTETEQRAAVCSLWSRGEIESIVIRGVTYVGPTDDLGRAAFAATPDRRRLVTL